VSQEFYKSVKKVLQNDCKGVTRGLQVLQERYKSVTTVLAHKELSVCAILLDLILRRGESHGRVRVCAKGDGGNGGNGRGLWLW
jgi:hypothetical protein